MRGAASTDGLARRAVALAAFGLLLATGCFSIQTSGAFGPQIPADVLSKVVPGETTKDDVLDLLGPPEEFLRYEVVEALSDDSARTSGAVRLGNLAHDVFTYQHNRVEARGRWWLLYLSLDAAVRSEVLLILFDEQDRVVERGLRRISDD